ncbi:hypothetical protein FOA52_007726 [Chlamydomonas sp. UWO 241]|nr:hypothetical protein FOA52_007726 [Chlamydomonas sp. UWO 241]
MALFLGRCTLIWGVDRSHNVQSEEAALAKEEAQAGDQNAAVRDWNKGTLPFGMSNETVQGLHSIPSQEEEADNAPDEELSNEDGELQ